MTDGKQQKVERQGGEGQRVKETEEEDDHKKTKLKEEIQRKINQGQKGKKEDQGETEKGRRTAGKLER